MAPFGEYMRVNLEIEGYSVREAESAEQALDAIEDHAPDLVLLDVVMPGVDGWQMLQKLQERHGSIPVIMFSGQVDERSAGEAEERGARAFVGKAVRSAGAVESGQSSGSGVGAPISVVQHGRTGRASAASRRRRKRRLESRQSSGSGVGAPISVVQHGRTGRASAASRRRRKRRL